MMIENPEILYNKEIAKTICEHYNMEDEEGWKYRVVEFPNGLAKIEVYDENNLFLGIL